MNLLSFTPLLFVLAAVTHGNPIEENIHITDFNDLISEISCSSELFQQLPETSFLADTLLKAEIMYPDSILRHFYFAVPSSYDPEIQNPMFIWLHGAVSSPDLRLMDPKTITEGYLIPRLLQEGYIIAFPMGQAGSTWWDPVGEEGILSIVQWMKSSFNVNDSKVFVGGFSDGASGSFSLMMLHPDYFAGYLAFSGHIGVSAISEERATYLPSLSNRSGFVTHTDEDGLYPTAKMAPTITLAETAGADIEYHTFVGFRHDPAYLPQIEDRIIEFLEETERVRFPSEILWETSKPSGCDWLRVDSIISWPLLTEDSDFNTLLVSDRLQFGFSPDRDFEGEGIYITSALEGDVPAARLAFTAGDVIVGFMNQPISNLEDLSAIQADMKAGDSFTIKILRDEEILEMNDQFNPPQYYWLLPRTAPSVRIETKYSNNHFEISTNRLCVIRLQLHPEMVDFSSDIVITCNGFQIFKGKVEEDGNFATSNLMENLDLTRCYTAEITLDLEELLLQQMYLNEGRE